MNNTTTVFQNGISISELGSLLKTTAGDIANVLNYPSCISFGLLKK